MSRTHVLNPTATAYNSKVFWCHPAFAIRSVYRRNDKELDCISKAAL